MDPELQEKLYKKFPKIFAQKDLTIQESAMPWGITCGNGWFWLLNRLCHQVQGYIDANKKQQVETVQVKEKFGGLRFSTQGACEYIHGMITFAESLSYHICERCGSTKTVNTKRIDYYIHTLCKRCEIEVEFE